MANVIHGHVKRYFNLPWDWIAGGFLRDAPPSAAKLYTFVYGYAHHHTATALQFSNDELHESLGLDKKSITVAREWLQERRLLGCRKCQPKIYEYTLLVPGTEVPIPPPPRRRGKRLYDATSPLKSLPRQRPRSLAANSVDNRQNGHVENNGKTTDYLKGLTCPNCRGPYTARPDGTSVCLACKPPRSAAPLTAKEAGF